MNPENNSGIKNFVKILLELLGEAYFMLITEPDFDIMLIC